MNDIMKYKEYLSAVHFSSDDEVFHGRIIGINDLVTFEGKSVTELKRAFKEAVEDYLETCAMLKKEPNKTYKGSFNVRVPIGLHREAALMASRKGMTLNELMKAAITLAISHEDELDRRLQKEREVA